MAEEPGIPSAGVRGPGTPGTLAPGSKVAGYVIEQQVGAGGMAVVYRARDEVLGRLVAIKVLAPALASDEEFRIRFLRESRAVAAVDEPHIVPVYGAGEAGGLLYIATRFVAGGDLGRLQRAAGGRLPPGRVADLVSQVASALDAAHAIGLVHRDVKPGNILVEVIPGRPEHAYLSDFGLSKSTAADNTGLTATGRFLGTPDYCAPEQVTNRGTVDGRADQYSLACVAFTLLAGAVPFSRGDSMARLFAHVNSPVPAVTGIRPELPAAVNDVLARGMAKNPAGRYESCTAFAQALRGALGLGTGPAYGASVPPAPFPGYQPTAVAAGWQPPSVQPAPAQGWQQPPAPVPAGWQGTPAAAGWQGSPGPQDSPGWQGPAGPADPADTFSPGAGGTVTIGGPGPGWPPGSGQAPPRSRQMAPGSGQGPRPPRRNTGLIAGVSAAAVILVGGVVAAVTLAGHGHGGTPLPTPSTSAPATTSPTSSGNTTPASNGPANTGTATLVKSVTAPSPMSYAFFSADGRYFVGNSTNSSLYVWSTSTFQLVSTASVAAGDKVNVVGFSPDDSTLYAIDTDTEDVYDLDVATGKATHVYPPPGGGLLGYAYSFGGSMMDFVSSDGTVSEYDMATGKPYATVQNPGTAKIATVRPDADGRYVLISDTNGVAYLVDAQSQQTIGTFHFPYSGSSSIVPQVSPDGNTVYVPGGSTGPAKIWNTATRSYNTPADVLWPSTDNGVTFSTDSRFDLTSPTTVSETVDIWNIATRAHVITVTVPGGANEDVESLGPGASELLSTSGLDITSGTFAKLDIWAIPG